MPGTNVEWIPGWAGYVYLAALAAAWFWTNRKDAG
jgi:hypothetical protein